MKIASAKKQAKAEKELQYHIYDTPEEFVAWSHMTGYEGNFSPFFKYTYEDSEFEYYVRRVQEILNNKKEHEEILNELHRKVEEAKNNAESEDRSVDLQRLADVFSPWEVPEELVKLAKYQNRKKDTLLCHFLVLSDGAEEILEVTDYSRIGKDKLKLFAEVDGGDLIGYWVKKSIEKSPIVYVNMDGTSCVIASNMREFIQTLISPYPDANDDEWYESEFEFDSAFYWLAHDKREFNNFKRWVKRNLDILPIEDRLKYARAAKKKFGNFDLWLEGHSE